MWVDESSWLDQLDIISNVIEKIVYPWGIVKDISSPQLDMCSTVKSPTPISSQDEDKT
jgi:hypothetical protein